MRRLWAVCAVALVALSTVACTHEREAGQPTLATTWPTARTPVPSHRPADPRITRRVCGAAMRAATGAVEVFNHHLSVIERAAARNDQAAMVSAATALTGSLSDVAVMLRTLSAGPVAPRVRYVLADAATALAYMISPSYPGTAADQRKRLRGLADAFATACD